jgi:hypothetical protein
MTAALVCRVAGFSIMLLLLFVPLATFQQPAGSATLEITSKRYSAGFLPVAGSYVEYEARLTNIGTGPVDGPLRVLLASDGDSTHLAAEYSVQAVAPGESKTLHLGPFRIEEEGGHRLLAEMGGVSLDYEPDSFAAYRPEAVQAALIAIPLIAAGAGLVGFSLYRKRRAV